MSTRLIENLAEIIIMNKYKVFNIIISFVLIILLLALAGTSFALIRKNEVYTTEVLKDKYNRMIYEYLRPNRKVMFLEFNTKKTFPTIISPVYGAFSNRFRCGFNEPFQIYNEVDKNIVNKKIFYGEKLRFDLNYKDGLCFYYFDNEDVKGNKSIDWYYYDEYKRLKTIKHQYTYKDEIRTSYITQYRYVYDFFSKIVFIFEFSRDEIFAVHYLKKEKDGYYISSLRQLSNNKEPVEPIYNCSAKIILENGLIKEIYETNYSETGAVYDEYFIKITYNDGLKTLEELFVKRKKDLQLKKIFVNEYQYENRQMTKEFTTNYDEWDRKNKEVSKWVSYNFVYDSRGNEISRNSCDFENFNDKSHNEQSDKFVAKTVITYKWKKYEHAF